MSAYALNEQLALARVLPARWKPLRYNVHQQAYWRSRHRFNTVPAGRRSGKTELGKRKLVLACMGAWRKPIADWPARYFAAAPVRQQAKDIFWTDLKALTPRGMMVQQPSETELTIYYGANGVVWAELHVEGLDKPERVEGSPWDGGLVDEIANTKEEAWPRNIRPALSDRNGWCDLIGVPEGRNHYYDLHYKALALMKDRGEASEWGAYHWKSAEILSAEEIAAAREDLDDLTFDQEYNASFINFEGRAYYPFMEDTHCAKLKYNQRADLILCFDFNVDPGVCAIVQEQKLPNQYEKDPVHGVALVDRPVTGTGVIGEVHIERNSNTPAVCRRIEKDWGKHRGEVYCYGDPTGGNRGSAKLEGSDWDIIERELRPVFPDRLHMHVKEQAPKERARVNAVNSRLLSKSGTIRLMVDGLAAPHVVKDFEGVTLLKGGSGEIDKKKAPKLTHLTDAIGYHVEYRYPVAERGMSRVEIGGA